MNKPGHGAMNVAPKYFQQIRSGEKTVEGRVAKEKFCAFRVGQNIEFVSENNRMSARIIELKRFAAFRDMLAYYGVKSCLPDLDCIDQGIAVYHSFPGYEADALKLGVIGIKIEVFEPVDTALDVRHDG